MQRQIWKAFPSMARAFHVSAVQAEPVEKIGFIGFGQMGSRMCNNLLSNESQNVVVYDDRNEALAEAESLNAELASSPASLASTEGVRVIFTMLPTTKAVRDAFLGSKGIREAAGNIQPSLLIDCSTTDPQVSREIAEEMTKAGLHRDSRPFPGCSSGHPTVLDAPVSGGINAAAAGTLTFMVGGSKEGAKAAEPYLHMLGKNTFYCGSNGNGQLAKVVNNLAMGIQMASIAEAMSFGIRNGINPEVLNKIVNTSSGRCWSSADYNPVPGVMENVPASRNYKGGFATSHMLKDFSIALNTEGEKSNGNLPMTQAAQKLYAKVGEIDSSLDFSAIFKFCFKQS